MSEAISIGHSSIVKAWERNIEIIENRLNYINWLFGVSSAALFIVVSSSKGLDQYTCHTFFSPGLALFFSGFIAFISVLLVSFGKYQGYSGITNAKEIITLADIQLFTAMKIKNENYEPFEMARKIVNFDLLPEEQRKQYDTKILYQDRWYSEILILKILNIIVPISLLFICIYAIEISI